MTRNAALSASLSLAELIVVTLRRYGSLSVDFLARVLDQRTDDIEEYVELLAEQGVLIRTGNDVSLSVDSPQAQPKRAQYK